MSPYELLPHTADVRVKATGGTRAGLLEAALKGMFAASSARLVEGAPETERQFDLASTDFESLLVDFLNEAISLSDANKEAYEAVRFDLITASQARGAFVGRAVEGFGTQIKAATHGSLKVEKNAEGLWEAVITFDA
jgi:SHS2 domain-containing protein